MRQRRLCLLLSLLLLQAAPALAILGVGDVVIDPTNLVQNTLSALNSVKSAWNTYLMVQNEYNMMVNQVAQIENQVKNLQHMPQGLNFFEAIAGYGNTLQSLMGQATTVSFELNASAQQFDGLYRQIGAVATSGDLIALKQRLLGARMDASGLAVQMQSLRGNMTDIYTRLTNLLNGSWNAAGNLDAQQMAAQQQGLMTHTLQTMQAMQAANARVMAQQQAEEVVLEQLRLKALQDLSAPMPRYTGGNGALVTYTW